MKGTRFAVLAAGSALLLGGCAAGDMNSTWGEYYQVAQQSFSGMFGKQAVKRDQAAAVPYASLGYRVNDGQQTLLILATDTRGEELWTSSSHIVLVTQDGRLTRTVGLPHDLGRLVPARGTVLPSPAVALTAPATVSLSEDFSDSTYDASVTCALTPADAETVTILGHDIPTTRVDETCESTALKWRFRNSYWIDSDRFVWRSLQHVSPAGDTLEIEVFRPPG